MNWRRFCATAQITGVVGGAAIGGAIFWAIIITGICRQVFKLGEEEAMLFIFSPLFIAIVIWLIRTLPKPLRKAGMLSDDPEKFGPWFKTDSKS